MNGRGKGKEVGKEGMEKVRNMRVEKTNGGDNVRQGGFPKC